MSSLSYYISSARRAPLRFVARRALERGVRQSGQLLVRLADTRASSYRAEDVRLSALRLGAMRETLRLAGPEWLAPVTRHYLEHRFDLLGSGWVRVRHGMTCVGLEGIRYPTARIAPDREGRWLEGLVNPANLAEAARIWGLIEGDYQPIDWQLDFKSGFRWSERTWYLDVRYGHRPGADIKVPWELARMQHLPGLALAYGFARERRRGFVEADRYRREFRNQIIDFVATNPPRFGVNWACTMDVAIRAVNWLIAYDLFRSFGAVFDSIFEARFACATYEHGRHIIDNLEWSPRWNGNHYLADVAGLMFVAGYLEQTPETSAWLSFAVQELVAQVRNQFGEDGGNLEGSTSYHRLAAETVAYATAFALGLPPSKRAALRHYDHRQHHANPPLQPAPLRTYESGTDGELTCFPPWYVERLSRMARFSRDVAKPDGNAAQIGDNDSGRFLKLNPSFTAMTVDEAKRRFGDLRQFEEIPEGKLHWQENHLDHGATVEAIDALFLRGAVDREETRRSLDAQVIAALAHDTRFATRCCSAPWPPRATEIAGRTEWEKAVAAIARSSRELQRQTRIELPGASLRTSLEVVGYPDFGIYVFRSSRIWLAVRCGPVGQDGVGGHAHNDQLSIELTIDGRDLWRDPGSYLYTAAVSRRNQYRSVVAHSGPRIGSGEPAGLDSGLFRLSDPHPGECIYFADEGFVGCYRGFGIPLYRVIVLEENRLTIADFKGELSPEALMPSVMNNAAPLAFSPGYGIRVNSQE